MKYDEYIIDDIEEFALSSRRLVFNGFGQGEVDDPQDLIDLMKEPEEESIKELDEILTQDESLVIIKNFATKQKHKTKNIYRYIINEKIFSQIIEALNTRMVSNILSSLTNKGLIESAYDEKIDDFVFWVKEEEGNNEKAETD
jgi:hypothetical protein